LIGGVTAINDRPDMRGWKVLNQFKIVPKRFQPYATSNIILRQRMPIGVKEFVSPPAIFDNISLLL